MRRSRRRGLVGHLISWFSVYPFRCQLCQHRFHARQKGLTYERIDEERREYERLQVALAATFTIGSTRGEGVIRDLSMGGCSLRTEAPLEVEDILYLGMQLPGQEDPLRIEVALVRNLNPVHANVEFLRFEGGERERLQQFIRARISEAASPRP